MAVTAEEVEQATILIELRGVYDGWSIAVMPDGRILNRWSEEDGSCLGRRSQLTQQAINAMSRDIAAGIQPPWDIAENKE